MEESLSFKKINKFVVKLSKLVKKKND